MGGGRKTHAPTLARVLDGYPPYEEPYPGPTQTLTLNQARANLAYLLRTKDARVDELLRRVAAEGHDLAPVLDPDADPLPIMGVFGEWFRNACFHDYPPERNDLLPNPRDMDAFRDDGRPFDGERLILSVAQDIAVLLGEAVIARRPSAYWGLWLAPDDRVMGYYKDVCILGLKDPFPTKDVPQMVSFDGIAVTYGLGGRVGSKIGKQWDNKLSQFGLFPPPPPLPDDMLPVHWPDEESWAERTAGEPALTVDETSGLFQYDENGDPIEDD